MKKIPNKTLIFCSVLTMFIAVFSGFNDGLFRVSLIAAVFWIVWILAHFYDEKTSEKGA